MEVSNRRQQQVPDSDTHLRRLAIRKGPILQIDIYHYYFNNIVFIIVCLVIVQNSKNIYLSRIGEQSYLLELTMNACDTVNMDTGNVSQILPYHSSAHLWHRRILVFPGLLMSLFLFSLVFCPLKGSAFEIYYYIYYMYYMYYIVFVFLICDAHFDQASLPSQMHSCPLMFVVLNFQTDRISIFVSSLSVRPKSWNMCVDCNILVTLVEYRPLQQETGLTLVMMQK